MFSLRKKSRLKCVTYKIIHCRSLIFTGPNRSNLLETKFEI